MVDIVRGGAWPCNFDAASNARACVTVTVFAKRSMAGSSRKVFDDYTVLEFIGETSDACEDDIHALFEALPLDWETTSPAPAPPMPAVENSTLFCTRYFAAND